MKAPSRSVFVAAFIAVCFSFTRCGSDAALSELDVQLLQILAAQEIAPLDPGPPQNPAKVALGRALFFDKILSGDKDVSCATCHSPASHTGGDLSLSIGVGGSGADGARVLGEAADFIPRNAPDLFNRGAPQWRTMFWDNRVRLSPEGDLITPAGEDLPPGLDGVLAAQAMFPVLSREEMRGEADDGSDGNELADIDDADRQGIWDALLARLLAIPQYQTLFAAAYPGVAPGDLGFQHAANAIAAFEIDAFTFLDSPWDRYTRGEVGALTEEEKSGAVSFFLTARCAQCHGGPLFTDQLPHDIAAPQVGPGTGPDAPLDRGAFNETGNPIDDFAFRTPPLRNVALTAPWLHDGAYTTLRAVVEHYSDPATALNDYDETQLRGDLEGTFQNDPEVLSDITDNLAQQLTPTVELTEKEVTELLAFLNALTSPSAADLSSVVPSSVPSGLPVGD